MHPGGSTIPGHAEKRRRHPYFEQVLEGWATATNVYGSRAAIQWYREQSGSPFSDPADRAVLSHVVNLGPIRLSDLADADGRTASNTSKIVQGLVLAGYVRRTIPDHDRRVTLLEATELGREVMRKITTFDLELIARHLETFSDAEVRAFAELMTAFKDRILEWQQTDLQTAGETNHTDG